MKSRLQNKHPSAYFVFSLRSAYCWLRGICYRHSRKLDIDFDKCKCCDNEIISG
jgi:hypothetical protein